MSVDKNIDLYTLVTKIIQSFLKKVFWSKLGDLRKKKTIKVRGFRLSTLQIMSMELNFRVFMLILGSRLEFNTQFSDFNNKFEA